MYNTTNLSKVMAMW